MTQQLPHLNNDQAKKIVEVADGAFGAGGSWGIREAHALPVRTGAVRHWHLKDADGHERSRTVKKLRRSGAPHTQ